MDSSPKPSLLERLSALLSREPEDREQLIKLLYGAYEKNLLDADALAKWRERTRASLFGRLTWQEITDNPQVRQPQHQQRRDA